MDILSEIMRIINESDNNTVPLCDGWCIMVPIPGLYKGEKLSMTFACPSSINTPFISRPFGRYGVDLENKKLIYSYPVDVFQDHEPVLLNQDVSSYDKGVMQYIEAYPRLFSLVFEVNSGTEEFDYCREVVKNFEAVAGELMDYYRWLSPELFDWLDRGEPSIN